MTIHGSGAAPKQAHWEPLGRLYLAFFHRDVTVLGAAAAGLWTGLPAAQPIAPTTRERGAVLQADPIRRQAPIRDLVAKFNLLPAGKKAHIHFRNSSVLSPREWKGAAELDDGGVRPRGSLSAVWRVRNRPPPLQNQAHPPAGQKSPRRRARRGKNKVVRLDFGLGCKRSHSVAEIAAEFGVSTALITGILDAPARGTSNAPTQS